MGVGSSRSASGILPELQTLRDLSQLVVELGNHAIGGTLAIPPDLNANLNLQVVAHGGGADVADLVGEVLDLAGFEVRRGNEHIGWRWGWRRWWWGRRTASHPQLHLPRAGDITWPGTGVNRSLQQSSLE